MILRPEFTIEILRTCLLAVQIGEINGRVQAIEISYKIRQNRAKNVSCILNWQYSRGLRSPLEKRIRLLSLLLKGILHPSIGFIASNRLK